MFETGWREFIGLEGIFFEMTENPNELTAQKISQYPNIKAIPEAESNGHGSVIGSLDGMEYLGWVKDDLLHGRKSILAYPR